MNMWDVLSDDLPSPRDEIIHNYDKASGAIRQGDYKVIVSLYVTTLCWESGTELVCFACQCFGCCATYSKSTCSLKSGIIHRSKHGKSHASRWFKGLYNTAMTTSMDRWDPYDYCSFLKIFAFLKIQLCKDVSIPLIHIWSALTLALLSLTKI